MTEIDRVGWKKFNLRRNKERSVRSGLLKTHSIIILSTQNIYPHFTNFQVNILIETQRREKRLEIRTVVELNKEKHYCKVPYF